MISAARALSPKPRPSLVPAAIANTFLTAPPTSMPGRSSLAYARSASPRSSAATLAVSAASVAATTSAVGNPRATSSANVGPVTVPTGRGHRAASARFGNDQSSPHATKPFASDTSGAATPAAFSAAASDSNCATGVAANSRSAPPMSPREDVSAIESGSRTSGR